jgi:hypothetical protein
MATSDLPSDVTTAALALTTSTVVPTLGPAGLRMPPAAVARKFLWGLDSDSKPQICGLE